MSSPNLCSESDILIRFDPDKAVDCVVRWLQDSSIARYFEDHPDARDTIVAAVQRLPPPETLSTPALTPCYTNSPGLQAPLPLTPPQNTQQLELINDRDADSSDAERTSCNSQYSTDLDVSSPFDRNNEIHNQDTSKGNQPSRRDATLLQAGIQSPHLGSRRSKRPCIEDGDETNVKPESYNSQLEIQPTSQQHEGLNIGQDNQASSPTVTSFTQQRQIAKLPRRSLKKNKLPKAVDPPYSKESDRFIELDLGLQLKVQKIADFETLKWAQEYLSHMRNPTLHVSNMTNEDVFRQIGSLSTAETNEQIIGKLRCYIERDDEKRKSRKVLSREGQVSERLHLAVLIGMFIKERDAWKTADKKRRKSNEIRLSPKDRFVNFLFPETMTYKGKHISQEKKKKRKEAKDKFDRWIRYGEPWAKIVQRFGYGILLVLFKLSNEDFRRLLRPHIELFLDYIDYTRPGLKDQLSNLSILLHGILYNRILPPQMLVLETLPLSEVGDRPLEELLKYYSGDQSTTEPAQELSQHHIEDQSTTELAQELSQHHIEDQSTTEPAQELPQHHIEDQDAAEAAQDNIPECPPEDPNQLSSPLGMDSRTLSDSTIDWSEYMHNSIWAEDRPNSTANEAKNNMIVNSREEIHASQASYLDNEYLLSPAINISFEELLNSL